MVRHLYKGKEAVNGVFWWLNRPETTLPMCVTSLFGIATIFIGIIQF